MYLVPLEIFDRMKVEKGNNFREINREKGGEEEISAYPVLSQTFDYNEMSRWEGEQKRGKRKW